MTRIFYVCDIHGSETVWRKVLNAIPAYKVDVVIVNGDLTGKAIVPIVKIKENEWYCAPWGKGQILRSEKEVEHVIKIYSGKGFYPYITSEEELKELKNNPDKVKELFTLLMKKRLRTWIDLVKEKVTSDMTIIVSPGNDDRVEIDEVLKADDRVIYPLKKVVYIDDHPMISCEWVNSTPWNTPRECPDEELEKLLVEEEFNRVDSYENLICCFHAPPYNTHLDIATKLDKNLKPVTRFGLPVKTHVGSKAVRKSFEKYQPLLGLHGHIHESKGSDRIGNTLCINPGSEYEEGILKACVIDLPPRGRKIKFHFVEG